MLLFSHLSSRRSYRSSLAGGYPRFIFGCGRRTRTNASSYSKEATGSTHAAVEDDTRRSAYYCANPRCSLVVELHLDQRAFHPSGSGIRLRV